MKLFKKLYEESINYDALRRAVETNINRFLDDYSFYTQRHSNTKYHSPKSFQEDFKNVSLDIQALTLILLYINEFEIFNSSIGLWAIKHHDVSGIKKVYDSDVIYRAVSWLNTLRFDPDDFISANDVNNSDISKHYSYLKLNSILRYAH